VSYGPDTEEAREYAARLWGWAAPGWKVMSELPGPASFEAYAELVRPEEITGQVPCGPDLGPYLKAAHAYADAGFTHVAFVQIGAERQSPFLEFAEAELLPALRGR
jgi:hypothetical protein